MAYAARGANYHTSFLAVNAGVHKARLDTKAPKKFSYIYILVLLHFILILNSVAKQSKLWKLESVDLAWTYFDVDCREWSTVVS